MDDADTSIVFLLLYSLEHCSVNDQIGRYFTQARRKGDNGKWCKDAKGKIIVDRREEQTKCEEVRNLNRTAAGLDDLAPRKKDLKRRNTSMHCFVASTLGMFLTQNSSCNNRASHPHVIGSEPKNEDQKKHDQNRVFKDNKYLAENPKTAHYADLKGNFCYNRVAVSKVIMNACEKYAPHLLETEMLEVGKQVSTMNPDRYWRWVYKDLFKRVAKYGFTSDWTQVKGNGKGGLALDGVVFFNEGLLYMPALIEFAIYLPEETRESFLETVNRGEATQKIWQIVNRLGLASKYGYPMAYDEEEKQGVFVIKAWMSDEDLDEHNKKNEEIRKKYVDCFKEMYKDRERPETEEDVDDVATQGEEVADGDNDNRKVGGSEEDDAGADGGQDGVDNKSTDGKGDLASGLHEGLHDIEKAQNAC